MYAKTFLTLLRPKGLSGKTRSVVARASVRMLRRRPTSVAAYAAIFGVAVAIATLAAAQDGLSAVDRRVLAERALRWAIEGGISDFRLVKDPSHVIVANVNLDGIPGLNIPRRAAVIMSPQAIQARADGKGDFLYFRFDRFSGDAAHARVVLSLVWAVAATSHERYLSGGGATLEFEQRDRQWRLLPVTESWSS